MAKPGCVAVLGGWGQNDAKAKQKNLGDLLAEETRAGVRAPIGAEKRRNGRGAKGCRKVDAQGKPDGDRDETAGSARKG
jgi:hypothetical protein